MLKINSWWNKHSKSHGKSHDFPGFYQHFWMIRPDSPMVFPRVFRQKLRSFRLWFRLHGQRLLGFLLGFRHLPMGGVSTRWTTPFKFGLGWLGWLGGFLIFLSLEKFSQNPPENLESLWCACDLFLSTFAPECCEELGIAWLMVPRDQSFPDFFTTGHG
jgi:hypothetical protein